MSRKLLLGPLNATKCRIRHRHLAALNSILSVYGKQQIKSTTTFFLQGNMQQALPEHTHVLNINSVGGNLLESGLMERGKGRERSFARDPDQFGSSMFPNQATLFLILRCTSLNGHETCCVCVHTLLPHGTCNKEGYHELNTTWQMASQQGFSFKLVTLLTIKHIS
jgi:hypothetical protein